MKAQECASLWACAGAGRKWILSCNLQKECCEPTPRFSLLGSVSDVHRPEDSESAALKANTPVAICHSRETETSWFASKTQLILGIHFTS